MTSRRTRKTTVFRCDKPGCTATHTAPFNVWRLAWPHAKRAGWVSAKSGEKWLHFCDWVHRPNNDRQLAELADEKFT